MPNMPNPALSVSAHFAEPEERRRQDKEAAELLQPPKQEEFAEFRKRLDNFQLTDETVRAGLERIRRAFERGENELMIASFPSSFCTDDSQAIINAGAPPITKPSEEEATQKPDESVWLAAMPAGARQVYNYWKDKLKPEGTQFAAGIINYPGGMPGDVGLFVSWPKSALDA